MPAKEWSKTFIAYPKPPIAYARRELSPIRYNQQDGPCNTLLAKQDSVSERLKQPKPHPNRKKK